MVCPVLFAKSFLNFLNYALNLPTGPDLQDAQQV